MANDQNLVVTKRELTNKSGRKNLRKEGKVPGVYYSHDSKESIAFCIDENELSKAEKSNARIFNINVGDKKRNVLFKSVQYHPVTDKIMHVDLYGIKMDQKVTLKVPISLTGTAVGVTEGGVLVQVLNEVELECLPSDIPEVIEIDISDLNFGENKQISDIDVNEKITIKSDANDIIASITQADKEEEAVPVSDEEGGEFLEGEESSEGDAASDTPTEQKDGSEDKADNSEG